jgi:glycogen operon protein
VEGPSDDPDLNALRDRLVRNFLATLAFSQGVPMLSHGDEMGRTQLGNNNAYCHDGELTWVDWNLDARRRDVLEFTRRVFGILRAHPVLRRRSFFRGHAINPSGVKDVAWLRPDGGELSDADWHDPQARALGMLLPGQATDERDERGRPITGRTLLLLLNAAPEPRRFALPPLNEPGTWVEEVDTARPDSRAAVENAVQLAPRSLVLLRYDASP